MAALKDLLVSYKQVEAPTYNTNVELPTEDKYTRLEQYANNKANSEEKPGETSGAKAFRWYVGNTTQTNMTTPSKPNNTPIVPKNEWVKQLSDAYRKIGVSENGIRNLIAKNGLESNWGKSAQGSYNYGNITTGSSWKGDYVNGHDHDAKGNPIRNKFRSYASMEDFAKDEVDFLKRLYDFDDSDDIDTFTYKLKGGNKGKRHYAEDPNYRNALKNVYNGLG